MVFSLKFEERFAYQDQIYFCETFEDRTNILLFKELSRCHKLNVT